MKNNLIINGSGDYPGGSYKKISIRGEGTILTGIESDAFHVYGTSEVKENVKTGSVKVLGEAEILGNLEAQETLVMGTMSVGQNARLKKLKVLGTLDTGGNISGNEANIKGSISVKGDAEFEEFQSSGGFDIKGLLNAEIIKVALRYGESTAEEIGGGKITIKRKRNSFFPFVGQEGTLAAKVIEGDDIFLENTKAEIVRGNKVKIGPGCQIGLVEYRSDFAEDESSSIKMSKKI
jgi:cytoskeletal protein CcmA (bactofilin family)